MKAWPLALVLLAAGAAAQAPESAIEAYFHGITMLRHVACEAEAVLPLDSGDRFMTE